MSPALTISTNLRSRSSSPARPPVSPITPTLPSAQLTSNRSGGHGGGGSSSSSTRSSTTAATASAQRPSRPTFTHSQPDQVGIAPPAPVPIAFESNPDVIALQSTISILQMQKRRATSDIQTLERIKNEAVEHTEDFLRDLQAGNTSGNRPLQSNDSEDDEDAETPARRSWTSIPQPQSVVRCPPINWAQYAVVGESLDKLHAEQVARPTQGTPGTVGAGGMYEFKGGDGIQEEYRGVSAPYAPLRDKIDRKPKSKK